MLKIVEAKGVVNEMKELGFPVPVKINRLWTIYDEDAMWSHYTYNPDTGKKVVRGDLSTLKLSDKHGAILEFPRDYGIDYEKNTLRYSPYADIPDGENSVVKIAIEYEKLKCVDCPNFGIGGFDEGFCGITGCSKGKSSSCNNSEINVFDHGDVYDRKEDKNEH